MHSPIHLRKLSLWLSLPWPAVQKHCYQMLFHYFAIYGAWKIAVGFTEKS